MVLSKLKERFGNHDKKGDKKMKVAKKKNLETMITKETKK